MKIIRIKNKIKDPRYKTILKQLGMYNTSVNQRFLVPDWYIRDRITKLPKWQNFFDIKEVFDEIKPFDYTVYKENSEGDILVSRTGGIGDILFFSAIMKKINKDFPDAKIYLATRYEYKDLPKLLGCEFIFTPIPINITNKNIKWVIFGEGIIEEPKYKAWNVYDLLASMFKIPMENDEKRPSINYEEAVDKIYRKYLERKYPRLFDKNTINIMIHFHSTSALRQIDFELFRNTVLPKIRKMIPDGYVLNLYSADHFKIKEKNLNERLSYVEEGVKLIYAKDLKQLTTLVSVADIVLSVDTALAHFAEGMNKRGFIFFTNIPSYARAKYYKYMLPIEPDWKDSRFKCKEPCYLHGHHVKDRCPMLPEDYTGKPFPICANYLFTGRKIKEITEKINEFIKEILTIQI